MATPTQDTPMTNQIAVLGAGYVGLTTAACLAHLGHSVVVVDVDAERVAQLNRAELPILEQGLDELVAEGLRSGQLRFVTDVASAVAEAEFVYLCVPTPQGADGSADLSYIEAAAREIGPHLAPEAVVINKSTVPVGSTRVVGQVLNRGDVFVVSNPEFLREGSAVHDFLHPDRVVIGCEDQAAAIRVASLYMSLAAPLMVTDPASAELIKYASNAFLATKVSFVNAIAALCEGVGADVRDVVLGMGYDKRIGSEFLRPGPGWGGSCFLGEETVLARRGSTTRLFRIDALFEQAERQGSNGWSVLSWRADEPGPEFLPVAAFTARPYRGDVVEITTKMGRKLRVTADHPMVVGDGSSRQPVAIKAAGCLERHDWLPVAQGTTPDLQPVPKSLRVVDAVGRGDIAEGEVICRLNGGQRHVSRLRDHLLPAPRRWDTRRSATLRLSEMRRLALPAGGSSCSTVTNGTYVPAELPLDEELLRVIGLYLAEGYISADGARQRIGWCFHPSDEDDLVRFVAGYWERHGLKATISQRSTSRVVVISSRLLAGWFEEVLRLGRSSYEKRLPDFIWALADRHKQALLRGLWDGDGSWSLVSGGPSVVFEYGTVSRTLADGMVRLLGDLGVVARIKVGRSAKSTTDTYWLTISGADALEGCLWLLPEDEQQQVLASLGRQAKRIAPTGYRRLSKNAAWVRIARTERRRFEGTVYSVEVPDSHTVVTSFGLVAHNCLPKDTRALVKIAEDGGYDFDLLRGVISVNEEQFVRVVDKVLERLDGDPAGATVGAWGITFKARTDDVRDSPAIAILARLLSQGVKVQAYDPAVDEPPAALPELEIAADPYAACTGADVLVVLTEWDEFRWLDFDKVADVMARPQVVDTRNVLDRQTLRRRGFDYHGLGQGQS